MRRLCFVFTIAMLFCFAFQAQADTQKNTVDPDKDSRILLEVAAEPDPYEVIKRLLREGADINYQGESGLTAMHHAVIMVNWKMLDFLIMNGADVNVQANGDTAIHIALNYDMPAYHELTIYMIRLLVEAGADLSLIDNEGRTALNLAEELGADEYTLALLKSPE